MKKPESPVMEAKYDLSALPEIKLTEIIDKVLRDRTNDPIVIPSQAKDLAAMLPDKLPAARTPIKEVLERLNNLLSNYCRRTTHPGFFGYIASGGLPVDPLSHALVAALNQNVVGYPGSPAAATIEQTVIKWLCEYAGYPEQAEGVFLSGGSIANLTALSVAIASCVGSDIRRVGLAQACDGKRPVILCSTATHFSIQRAAAMLGVGTNNVICVETDDCNRVRMDRLEEQFKYDHTVLCVVASAGSTTTGAVDPLADIADLCSAHSTWLHVDAAYGGGVLLCPELRHLFDGIDRADSISMDLHKWFFNAIDSSVLLYRNPSAARELFYEHSDYILFPADGPPEQHMFFHLGPELSRRFRALPAFIAFCHYGAEAMGRNIFHNVECARYLAELVDYDDNLEIVAMPQLSIVNFRYTDKSLSVGQIDLVNEKIREEVEKQGQFLMSATRLHGRPVLRVCIVNHATRSTHIEGLIDTVLELGQKFAKALHLQ
ncbi:MAG: aminotransferase class I/II-fold pyridoxal phosphate-dependent enzyme [Arenicellales bacterium]